MQVRMKTNLGWVDARAIGVNPHECLEGMLPEVSDKAGEWLVSTGKAEELPAVRAVPQPTINAVPPQPKAAARGKHSDKSNSDKEE